MDYASKRSKGGVFEGIYKTIMRRNSVYVTFVILGAFAGERAVDYGVHKLWEYNNVGVAGNKVNRSLRGVLHSYSVSCLSLMLCMIAIRNAMKTSQFWGKGRPNELPIPFFHAILNG